MFFYFTFMIVIITYLLLKKNIMQVKILLMMAHHIIFKMQQDINLHTFLYCFYLLLSFFYINTELNWIHKYICIPLVDEKMR